MMLPRTLILSLAALLLASCPTPSIAANDADQPQHKEPTTMSTTQPTAKVTHTDEEWRKLLTPEQYRVLRQAGTERAFTGQYTDTTTPGTYFCAACGAELFHSATKFHSGCGWPSFYAAAAGDRVILRPDHSHGMTRTEVLCSTCGSHLGHVFDDAPDQPTGQRYCINSVSLKFVPDSAKPATTQPTSPSK
jgi:peptide-methionine (R)-S-oxide reductase